MPLKSLFLSLFLVCVAVVGAAGSVRAEPPPFEIDESVADEAVPADDGAAEADSGEDLEEISGRFGNDARQRLDELREWLRRREAERAENGESDAPDDDGLGESARVLDFREGNGYVPDPLWQRRALRRHFAGWARQGHFSRHRHHAEHASGSGHRGAHGKAAGHHDRHGRIEHRGSGKSGHGHAADRHATRAVSAKTSGGRSGQEAAARRSGGKPVAAHSSHHAAKAAAPPSKKPAKGKGRH